MTHLVCCWYDNT